MVSMVRGRQSSAPQAETFPFISKLLQHNLINLRWFKIQNVDSFFGNPVSSRGGVQTSRPRCFWCWRLTIISKQHQNDEAGVIAREKEMRILCMKWKVIKNKWYLACFASFYDILMTSCKWIELNYLIIHRILNQSSNDEDLGLLLACGVDAGGYELQWPTLRSMYKCRGFGRGTWGALWNYLYPKRTWQWDRPGHTRCYNYVLRILLRCKTFLNISKLG